MITPSRHPSRPGGASHDRLIEAVDPDPVTSMERNRRLLEALTRAQTQYVNHAEPRELFGALLRELLAVTKSESGFVGEVRWPAESSPYVNVYAVGEAEALDGTSAEALDALQLDPMTLGVVVNSLMAAQASLAANGDLHAAAAPMVLHDVALGEFLGIPLLSGETIVGIVGVARDTGPYTRADIEFLEPFAATCANLIVALRADLDRRDAEQALREQVAQMRAILDSTLDGIITIDERGIIVGANIAV